MAYCDADSYFNDLERRLEKMPKCNCCKEHIQDEKWIQLPDGEILCESCAENEGKDLWINWAMDQFRVSTENLMGE